MKITHLLTVLAVLANALCSYAQQSLWTPADEQSLDNRNYERQIFPQKYSTYKLDLNRLRLALDQVPERFNHQGSFTTLDLPMPDGTIETFAIVAAPVMHPDLARKFPEIKTYSGQGITHPASAVYLDWTPSGVHAMVIRPGAVYYVDPYFKDDNSVYLSYDRQDYFPAHADEFECLAEEGEDIGYLPSDDMQPIMVGERAATTLRTYRIAIAASGEYTTYFGGTKAGALAAINTTLNRVRGIYETELSISFTLIPNNDDVIYTNGATDPYTYPPDTSNLTQNQSNLDATIGTANYDIGHIFSTGSGGVATLNGVCKSATKGRGLTASSNPITDAFYIDFVAHEIGHQFGAHHTFNGSTGSCSGTNRNAGTAYEPGSGSTIMSYAGICGSQNLQKRSNAYFHLASLNEITLYTTVSDGATCPTTFNTTNNPPVVNSNPHGMNGKYIPISTPFELTASGSDPDSNPITFSWEQWNLGPQGAPSSSSTTAPLFRSFTPSSSPTRIVPSLSDILDNTTSLGEKLPSVTRDLNFYCTVRDNQTIGGGYDTESFVLHATNTAGPFAITSHNSSSELNGSITVTWNVANTISAPVSCANVDIMVSLDGGSTFTTLVAGTANDGTESVALPNTATNMARIKVKCSDNVFFDINNADLRIVPSGSSCSEKMTSGTMESTSGWTQYSALGFIPIIGNWSSYTGVTAHGGTGYAWLGSDNNETTRLSQTISIPSNAHFANLTFWYRFVNIDCGNDVFNIKVNGTIVKTYNLCNDPGAHDWTRATVDLSSYIGTSPTIMFECVTNATYFSDVLVDDASVYVCEGGAFAPLPVELGDFRASTDGENAYLDWFTVSEENNKGFEVEMQLEAGDFNKIGFVPGRGNSTGRADYQFVVKDLAPGNYYFRLNQMDIGGENHHSPVRSVSILGNNQVLVYPNPARDIVHFTVALETETELKLELLDGLGRVVGLVAEGRYSTGRFDLAFDADKLSPGVYYYRLSGQNLSKVGKLLVED